MGFYDAFTTTSDSVRPPIQRPHANIDGTRYGQAALQQELDLLARAAEGTRNDQLNRTWFAISQLVTGGQIDQATAADAVATIARRIGLDETEIKATMGSAWRAGSAQPRTPAPLETQDAPPVTVFHPQQATQSGGLMAVPQPHTTLTPEQAAEQQRQTIRQKWPLTDLAQMWDQEDDTEWLLYPLIPARRLVALYSAPKMGKSLLMLEIAYRLSLGQKVLGYTPDHPVRCLYLDFENDPVGDTISRLKAMGATRDQFENNTNFAYMSYPMLGGLDTTTGSANFLDILDAYQPHMVILDTVSRAIEGEENANDTFLQFYQKTEMPMKKAGITLVRLDHAGKDESKGQRGGSSKSGDVDAIWKMTKTTDTIFDLWLDASRQSIGEQHLTIQRHMMPLRHTVVTSDAARRERVDEINGVLDKAGAGRDVTVREARVIVKDAGLQASTDWIAEALRERKERPFGVQASVLEEMAKNA